MSTLKSCIIDILKMSGFTVQLWIAKKKKKLYAILFLLYIQKHNW